jgi:membrane protein required for colicin V production
MTFDILFLAILVWAIYRGWTKGLVMSLFELVSYFVAFFLALQFSDLVERFLKERMDDDSSWLTLIAFLLTLIVGIIGVQFIGKIIEKSLELVFLGTANKIMGVAVNAFMWISLYAAVLALLDRFEWTTIRTADSKSAGYLLNWGRWLIDWFR